MESTGTEEVAEEYRSSLKDLTVNSKPLITMLTMLADENRPHASVIVKVIEEHIHEVSGPQKLPVMYLIDSIMKNVGQDYIKMFGHNIITTFSCVFEKVDEKTRKKLYELRHTWNEVFPKSRLYGLDVKVQSLDPAWPLPTGPVLTSQSTSKPNIHINPNIIKPGVVKATSLTSSSSTTKNNKNLEILRREEQILELERQKLMIEKKKILLQQSRHVKPDSKAAKGEPEKPIAKPIEDPSISSERRSEFLRSYKIKKVNQNKEESKVSSTIHVDPRRVHQVLPVVAASQDSRRISETSRDPRLNVENNRDPRIISESSRDPRLNSESSRDPRLNSALALNNAKADKPSEVQVTSSRDPRVVGKEQKEKEKGKEKEKEKEKDKDREKEKEKEKLKEEHKSKKEMPTKHKKEKESKSPKSETRSTRSLHRAKDKEKKEKDSPVLSSSKPDITQIRKTLETPITDVGNITTTFKSSRRNKQRTYKRRDESLEEEYSPLRRVKQSHEEAHSDSDDSDHYRANKPNPALYNKSVKKPEVTSPATSTSVTGDTDYRQFTSPPKRPATTDENVSPPKKECLIEELFSKKDVDYRQLLPRPGLLPTPGLPAAFNMKDQDDRKPSSREPGSLEQPSRDPLVPLSISENQDSNNPHPKGEMGPSGIGSLLLGSLEHCNRKSSFNSPHAASWEKFRERNPEFKEYQRQASTSESDRGFGLDEEEHDMPFNDNHHIPTNRTHNFRAGVSIDHRDVVQDRPRDWRRIFHEDDEDSIGFQGRIKASQENFKVILKQALEQKDRGEISEEEYQHMANKLRMLTEQEQIREARERERLQHRTLPQSQKFQGEGDWSGPTNGPASLPSSGPGGPGLGGRSPGGPGTGSPGLGSPGLSIRDPGLGGPGHSGPGPGGPVPSSQGPGGLVPGSLGPSGPGLGSPKPVGQGPGTLGPSVPSQNPGVPPGSGRGRGCREGHVNFTQGVRGGRGAFMGTSAPSVARGMVRTGRGGLGLEDDGWGRGGMRGRGRRGGRGGHNLDDRGWTPRDVMLEDEWTGEPDLPFVTEETLKAVTREAETRTIDIDGMPREIRTYGETALVLLDWNDPRVLTFGEAHCNVVFDEGKFVLPMRIGEDYKEFTIAGETHRVKLGVPTQELMLDGRGYQCFFGGKPITVHLAGQPRTVSLDGKPPNVNIGPVTNTEFLAGKIQLVINAKKVVNLFLDAKPQRFNIDGKPFVLKFVDALRGVTINNVRFPVEFGGLPLSISVRGYRRFLRFTSLPQGIIPGQVTIRGMEKEGQKLPSLPGSPAQDRYEGGIKANRGSPSIEMSRKPPMGYPTDKPPVKGVPHPSLGISAPEGVFVHQGPPPKGPASQGLPPQRPLLQGPPPHCPPLQGSLPSGPPPQVPSSHGALPPQVSLSQGPPTIPPPGGLISIASMAGQLPPQPGMGNPPVVSLANMSHPPPNAIPGSYMTNQLPPNMMKPSQPPPSHAPLNLNSLLESLTRTGLIGTKVHDRIKNKKDESEKKKEEEEEEKEREKDEMIPVEFMFNSENLRKRKKWLIESLYRGMQCSSCGLRYPPEQTLQYSHHLDWHFRQNRRQQESTKKANTRRFYFSIEDWLQYEEIEDVEERVPSMFENEGIDEAMEAEDAEEPSVAVSSESALGVCPTCHDTFSQFFHQETEEWRYHNAIQVDGVNYHPACHQDMLRAEAAAKEADEKEEEEKEKEEEKEALEEEVQAKEDGEMDVDKKDEKATDGKSEEEPVESQVSETEKEVEKPAELQLPVHIKEEPMEVEEIDLECLTSSSLPVGMMIKQEVKKEPIEHDEDDVNSGLPEEDEEANMFLNESNEEPPWDTPIVSVNAAETDIASSIDGNTELSTADTTQTNPTVTKIKLNMSRPTINNNNNESSNGKKKKDDCIHNSNSIDEDIEEFVPPPFTIDYDLKPGFKNVELIEQPLARRGVEMSGLCTLM